MSKRKVQFSEENMAAGPSGEGRARAAKNRRFKEKHSLDSDEEDEDRDQDDVLLEDDIEGQEDDTIDNDEGISITPFNMREEHEEGHFNKDGNFVFKKEKEIRDNWMDNIDWMKIKHTKKKSQEEEEEDEDEPPPLDKTEVYRDMLQLMRPGESVLEALKRFGKSKPRSASERWRRKRGQAGPQTEEARRAEEEDRRSFDRLTGHADRLVSNGNMEIYQETYEKISFVVQQEEARREAQKTTIPEGMDDDDALEMFAGAIDKQQGGGEDNEDEKASQKNGADNGETHTVVTEIHGPYPTSQMIQWKDEDFFKAGVYCRRAGTEGQFHSSARIDFDLWT